VKVAKIIVVVKDKEISLEMDEVKELYDIFSSTFGIPWQKWVKLPVYPSEPWKLARWTVTTNTDNGLAITCTRK
jgi:hypothetical protein